MALNALESFVINTKDKLEQDFYIQASTEEEREKIREKLNEVIRVGISLNRLLSLVCKLDVSGNRSNGVNNLQWS
jgi:hypothetical protein